jgi:predicted dienelactone hydrolase
MVTRRRLLAAVVFLLPAFAHARCPAGATTAGFAAAGKFGVGVRTIMLVDASRPTPPHAGQPGAATRTLVTEVWYPTAPGSDAPVRDAPIARGRFPLLINSHGLLDNRLGETYYATALASRGFVVASADFPLTHLGTAGGPWLEDVQNQPGDVRFLIDVLTRASVPEVGWLARRVHRRRIGAVGLSLGGATTALVSFHPTLRDPRVRAALGLATAGGCATTERYYRESRVPFLLLHGDRDLIVPFESNARHVFELARSRRQLVTLVDATHTAFSGFITFELETTYDELGCLVLAEFASWGDPLAGLADAAHGIDPAAASCVVPCLTPPPSGMPMQAARQHELTRAVVAAFFESTLGRARTAARCFLRETLAAENADVRVESRRAAR